MSDVELLGVSGDFALFGDTGGLTVAVGMTGIEALAPQPRVSVDFSRWGDPDPAQVPTEAYTSAAEALHRAAPLAGTDVLVASGGANRLSFSVPKAVRDEAQRGLDWRREHGRGGTDVGLSTARTLTSGDPVGIVKVRHVSRYFPRHAGDRDAAGWRPGEDGYPSNGRIAWALWGGDAGRRWAEGIMRRQDEMSALAAADAAAAAPPEVLDSDSYEDYTPGTPHEYIPDPFHNYACLTCLGPEVAAEHVLTPAEPVVAGAGWSPDDSAVTEFYLDADIDADGTPGRILEIHAVDENALWYRWGGDGWLPEDDRYSDGLLPLDPESVSAVVELLREGRDPTCRDIGDPDEWDIAEQGGRGIPLESADGYEGTYAATYDPERNTVLELFLSDISGQVWRWDGTAVAWSPAVLSGAECAGIDTTQALQASRWLSGPEVPADRLYAEFQRGRWFGLATVPDGEYTPEERSKNAASQVRDAKGRFTAAGAVVHDRTTNKSAEVIDADASAGTVKLRYGDGRVSTVPSGEVVRMGTKAEGGSYKKMPDYDFSKVIAQPRAVATTPKAMLPYLLPALDDKALGELLDDFDAFIEKERKRGVKPLATQDPDHSDVAPLYLAQVDELDKQAVVELYALVPKTPTTRELVMYVRRGGGWERDDKALARLRSTNPPPIVTLDAATYKLVVEQVDSYYRQQGAEDLTLAPELMLWDEDGTLLSTFEARAALRAAGVPGIADTPGDVAAARRLKHYWLRGAGAAKIRWNTGGDWTRCVRYLSKYLGVRAKGYCANLHHEATGLWTGDRAHRQRFGRQLATTAKVLADTGEFSDDTQMSSVLHVELPTRQELLELQTRPAGHTLIPGERFLAVGGDTTYAVTVLDPQELSGWEPERGLLVSGPSGELSLLCEA